MKKIMKKIILLCLTLACSISFFACDLSKDDKFYEETNEKFNTFIELVCENEKYSNGLIYGENITAMQAKYEQLVNQILTEENQIIESHKKDIDLMVGKMKIEMSSINTVEAQQNIDEYIQKSADEGNKNLRKVSITFVAFLIGLLILNLT